VNGVAAADGKRVPFYACAANAVGPNRIFVFPSPAGVAILADDDVSWYYQVPLSQLSIHERQREITYREQNRLQFPLKRLPD
jgi:hypothetical protein